MFLSPPYRWGTWGTGSWVTCKGMKLSWCYSKWGCSSRATGNLRHMQILKLHPDPWNRNSVGGSRNPCFNKPSRWFWGVLHFQNHKPGGEGDGQDKECQRETGTSGEQTWGKQSRRVPFKEVWVFRDSFRFLALFLTVFILQFCMYLPCLLGKLVDFCYCLFVFYSVLQVPIEQIRNSFCLWIVYKLVWKTFKSLVNPCSS